VRERDTGADSEAELTFDTTGVSVDDYRQLILSPARTSRRFPLIENQKRFMLRGEHHRGSFESTQIPTVTRFEYILRAEHLRKVKISTPLDLAGARHLDLNSLCSLRELDETAFKKLVTQLDDLRVRAVQHFRRNLTLQDCLRVTRLKLPKSAFLKPAIAKRLEKMQRRLLYDPYLAIEPLRK